MIINIYFTSFHFNHHHINFFLNNFFKNYIHFWFYRIKASVHHFSNFKVNLLNSKASLH